MAQKTWQDTSLYAAAKATGLSYSTVWRHAHGHLRPKGEHALLYERMLGIPRSTLRPDLWPPTDNSNKPADPYDRQEGEKA